MNNEQIREKLLNVSELDSGKQNETGAEITYQILQDISTRYLNKLSGIETPFYAGVFGALHTILMDTMSSNSELGMMKLVEDYVYRICTVNTSEVPFE